MEITRQTALVLEDMLRAISGDLPSYPFQKKLMVPETRRVASVNARSVIVRQQKAPIEQLSNLKKQRQEEQTKTDEEMRIDREKKDIERIRRQIYLKQKLAIVESQSHSVGIEPYNVEGRQRGVMGGVNRALSEKKIGRRGGPMASSQASGANIQLSQALEGLKVLDPSGDKKQMAKMRAQMLQAS